MKIARVFPRRTKASPDDELAFFDTPGLFPPVVDEVHVSVTFTWDIPRAEQLAREWERVALVKIGGPALGNSGGEFEPGKYLRPGWVITSRGCPNRCWFCSVWRREGQKIKTLEVKNGWIVQDDNLLACPDEHIKRVFSMLALQKNKAEFRGGLESKRLKSWHAKELFKLKAKQIFFAYDSPEDLLALQQAGSILQSVGFSPFPSGRCLRSYVLIGYPKDTLENAEKRMFEVVRAGFMPMAMLYRNTNGETEKVWRKFQRLWARPQIIAARNAR